MTRSEILDTAKQMVCGDREEDYGTPENNFTTIAHLWSAYKNVEFSALDVAMMMALLKVARIKAGTKTDSFVDLAGYAACAGEIAQPHKEKVGNILRDMVERQNEQAQKKAEPKTGTESGLGKRRREKREKEAAGEKQLERLKGRRRTKVELEEAGKKEMDEWRKKFHVEKPEEKPAEGITPKWEQEYLEHTEKTNRRPIDDGKIVALREAGWSWKKVGEELQISPQTALMHYNKAKEEKADEQKGTGDDAGMAGPLRGTEAESE